MIFVQGKDDVALNDIFSPSNVAAPKYLKPGRLAQLRDMTQWLRHETSRNSYSNFFRTDPSNASPSKQQLNEENGEVIISISNLNAPTKGNRRIGFTPKVMRRHAKRIAPDVMGSPYENGFQSIEASHNEEVVSKSIVDVLPLEILVNVMCQLSHREISMSSIVCKSFHEAAQIATHLHFNYLTPERQSVRSAILAFRERKSMSNSMPSTPGAPEKNGFGRQFWLQDKDCFRSPFPVSPYSSVHSETNMETPQESFQDTQPRVVRNSQRALVFEDSDDMDID